MAAFASSNSATGLSGSITITKPTGLAENDLMVAFVADSSFSDVPDTPSGWTKIIEHTGDLQMTITAFAKVASAADAAATDFTFTHPNAGADMAGVLYRITGTVTSLDCIYREASNTGTEPSADVFRFASGFTPSTANSLLIMAITGYSNSGGFDESHASVFEIETNNPAWTERDDFTFAAGEFLFSTATAIRTETTPTGYYQVTYSVSGNDSPSNASAILLAITDIENGTHNATVITATAAVQAPTASGSSQASPAVVTATATINAPTASSADPLWKNTDKPSPGSITNTTKPV